MIPFLARALYYPVVALFLAVLVVRKANRKRFALLAWALLFLGLWGVVHLFARFSVREWLLVPFALIASAVVLASRGTFFPWRLKCARCGRGLSLRLVALEEGDLCEACRGSDEQE